MVAGGAGAACRYVVDVTVARRVGSAFPWGTLLVNVTGSFALGALAGLVVRTGVSDPLRTVAATGFVGGYTTFSTLMFETQQLLEGGARGPALANAVGSVLLGTVAAAAGSLLTV